MPAKLIITENRFAQFGNELERGIERALGQAAGIVVAGSRGGFPGSIGGSVRATPAERSRSRSGKPQITVHVAVVDYRGIFYELGTLGRRKRMLAPQTKRKPRALKAIENNPRSGIKARYALTRAARLVRGSRLLALLDRNLPG